MGNGDCATRDAGWCDLMDEEAALEYAEQILCGNCDKDAQIKRLTAHLETWKVLAQARYTKMVSARLRIKELEGLGE